MNPLINNQKTPNIRGMFEDFSKNPVAALTKAKFNIPENIGNNPQGILQHLLNSGQISQQQINTAQQRLSWLNSFFK